MLDLTGEFKRTVNRNIKREGADKLLEWLENETDFFTAPASSRYHLARPGGLCEHSLNVCAWLVDLLVSPEWSCESLAIVGLFHDVCKANFYEQGWRNQKTYEPEKVATAPRGQVKHDQGGDFIWETVPSYTINDQFPYGHGEKSVYLIRKHMVLTDAEAQAIRFHMGPWQDGEKQSASAAFKTNPLAFWLHVADEAATFITEKEEQ